MLRRHWAALLVLVVLALGGALGGVAAGYAIWGYEERSEVQEYARELPSDDGWALDDTPRDDGTLDRQGRHGYDESDSSASDSTTTTGPSATEVAAITAEVSPGVVNIDVTSAYGSGSGAGTGMVLTSSGLVLTNNHVIEGAVRITATSVGNGRSYTATVLGYDAAHDVALLQLEGAAGLSSVAVGDSSSVAIGQQIVVIGNAGGDGGEPTASGGAVTALDQQIVATGPRGAEELDGLIQVSANVVSGQSGGPVVNTDGDVVGITTAASMDYSFDRNGGTGFAVPIDTAMAIVAQIRDGNESGSVHVGPTAFLGVQVLSSGGSGMGYGPGHDPGYGATAGALVARVLPGTPAERAGLRSGDLITAVDGRSIDAASGLSSLLGEYEPGDTVTLEWVDQYDARQSASVTLMEGPPA
jgi:S1-C subfamily serine protease